MPLAKLESKTVTLLRRRIKRLVAAEIAYINIQTTTLPWGDREKALTEVVAARKSLDTLLSKMDEPAIDKK